MAQIPAEWKEVEEWDSYVKQLIEKYPEQLGHVDPTTIIAYKCINKTKPPGKSKSYDMSGQTEPESFTNSKKYFVKMFSDTWDLMDEVNRLWLIFSALKRIDPEKPGSGKVGSFDLHDHAMVIRTAGADWETSSRVPHLLNDNVKFVQEPELD